MNYKAIVIGRGNIGGELISRLAGVSAITKAVVARKGVYTPKGEPHEGLTTGGTEDERVKAAFGMMEEEKPDVAFLAIPTTDDGSIALRYIQAILARGCKVVTSEKGALAHHFETLRPHLSQIGYRATVGGGTMMIPALRVRQMSGKPVTVNAVVNGTLNYIFAGVALEGRSLAEMVREAASLQYAEPGANDPLAVVRGEVKDVKMKLSVLFNAVFAKGEYLHPDSFQETELSDDDLLAFTDPGAGYRYLTRLSNNSGPDLVAEGSPGSLKAKIGKWRVEAGFYNVIQGTDIGRWFPSGVNNAVMVKIGHHGDEGVYEVCRGPGAGPAAPAEAMLADAKELLAIA